MMKKLITLTFIGTFLLTLQGPVRAQKQAQTPAIPPMLEGHRPLAQSESQEPEGPIAEEGKAGPKVKGKTGKTGKNTASLKTKKPAKTTAAGKKKRSKAVKKKGPAPAGPAGTNT